MEQSCRKGGHRHRWDSSRTVRRVRAVSLGWRELSRAVKQKTRKGGVSWNGELEPGTGACWQRTT